MMKLQISKWGPNRFRPPHGKSRKPVKGGRWKVRRVLGVFHLKPWRAWTEGRANNSKRFATQAEAFVWADRKAREWAATH